MKLKNLSGEKSYYFKSATTIECKRKPSKSRQDIIELPKDGPSYKSRCEDAFNKAGYGAI